MSYAIIVGLIMQSLIQATMQHPIGLSSYETNPSGYAAIENVPYSSPYPSYPQYGENVYVSFPIPQYEKPAPVLPTQSYQYPEQYSSYLIESAPVEIQSYPTAWSPELTAQPSFSLPPCKGSYPSGYGSYPSEYGSYRSEYNFPGYNSYNPVY